MSSKHYFTITLIIGLTFSMTSCCTKKSCDQEIIPNVPIFFADAPESEQFLVKVTRIHTTTNSVTENYTQSYGKWYSLNLFFNDKFLDAYNYKYLISSPYNKIDTISSISYQKTTQEVDCNTCFPFGDGSAVITEHKNLRYTHDHKVYYYSDTFSDTLVLRK